MLKAKPSTSEVLLHTRITGYNNIRLGTAAQYFHHHPRFFIGRLMIGSILPSAVMLSCRHNTSATRRRSAVRQLLINGGKLVAGGIYSLLSQ